MAAAHAMSMNPAGTRRMAPRSSGDEMCGRTSLSAGIDEPQAKKGKMSRAMDRIWDAADAEVEGGHQR